MTNYNFSKLYVTIVDDQPPMRILLRGILKELGVNKVKDCTNGVEALETFAGFPPDVIFTDYAMEPMDGLEMIRHIRTGEANVDRFVPIVVVSAYTEVQDIIAARDMGATEFLAKPVSATQVYKRLKSVVENPRTFVDSESFFGPDRRRRLIDFEEDDRRKIDYVYGEPATA